MSSACIITSSDCINSSDDVKLIIKEAEIFNFLIGESLLKSSNIGHKLREFAQITL